MEAYWKVYIIRNHTLVLLIKLSLQYANTFNHFAVV